MKLNISRTVIHLSIIVSFLLSPRGDLFADDASGKIMCSSYLGISNPTGALGEEMSAGGKFGISIVAIRKSKWNIGLTYNKGDYAGKGERKGADYTLSSYLLTYGGCHKSDQLLTLFHFSIGYLRIERRDDDGNDFGGGFIFEPGIAVEYKSSNWLSVGPRLNLSWVTCLVPRRVYSSYNPPSYITVTDQRKSLFVDVSIGVTIHL